MEAIFFTRDKKEILSWKVTLFPSAEKNNCNVPWAILMDPTSACNLRCTGCWAAECHQLNLDFNTLDSIIQQGKEMGTYMYIYTGGEPLVRKKDLIKLCEKHSGCEFLSFTNGTLIDEEFCQEMLRVKNFVPAISLEGFETANDGRRCVICMVFPLYACWTGSCIAGGRSYFHINAVGDVEPCVFVHYSNVNIHDCTVLETLKSPIFMVVGYFRTEPEEAEKKNGLFKGLLFFVGGLFCAFRSTWFVALIGAILSLVFAILIIVNPFASTAILWTFIAVSLIIEAVADILTFIFKRR